MASAGTSHIVVSTQGPVEGQFVLPVAGGELVLRQAESLEPRHEVGSRMRPWPRNTLPRSHVTSPFERRRERAWSSCSRSSPSSTSSAMRTRACGWRCRRSSRPAVPAQDRLRHQELVEIRIEERPHDRIDAEAVVVHPLRQIEHYFGTLGRARGRGRAHGFTPRVNARRVVPPRLCAGGRGGGDYDMPTFLVSDLRALTGEGGLHGAVEVQQRGVSGCPSTRAFSGRRGSGRPRGRPCRWETTSSGWHSTSRR